MTSLILILQIHYSEAQSTRHLYRPQQERLEQANSDSVPEQAGYNADSIAARRQFMQDSLEARIQFVRDSLEKRAVFVRDSIAAREAFVRDSIARRERMLDSLRFLQSNLPALLDASLKNFLDDVVVFTGNVYIIGDSILNNYSIRKLPFTIDKPYTPWETTINLSDKPVLIKVNKNQHKITSIVAPEFESYFQYERNKNILRINEKSSVVNRSSGKIFKSPIDSVFFDARGRVVKVKRYLQLFQVTAGYQRGAPILLHLSQVKQYDYTPAGDLLKYEIVNFCDRWKATDEKKVCYIVTYNISKKGNGYTLNRKQEPENDYADGTYSYEFDQQGRMTKIAFKNLKNSENWLTFVETNLQGNVSRYVYQVNGKVNKTLLINYYPDTLSGNRFETITCLFEDDGVGYLQRNNTTGKIRERNMMTGDWGPWK
ncbi:MAG: hypothetical protein JW894_11605 [Bacteroidales bacterium]|nr:hypothetical protein [Bacteroidales bacterium]